MQIITHPTSPYSLDYIHQMGQVGFRDEFKTSRKGMERSLRNLTKLERHRKRRAATAKSFANRPGRVPWPWEETPE